MVYQAIWAPTSDFNEVIISRKMLHDHSPYVVLDALNKVNGHSDCFPLYNIRVINADFCMYLILFVSV